MKKCAFLSINDLSGHSCYDYLAIEALKKYQWQAEQMSWRNTDCDWNQFELVIIRSTWDYQDDVEAFLEVLERINDSSARLENPLKVVRWNINKKYLQKLEEKGVNIVPTVWKNSLSNVQLVHYFEYFHSKEIIIKPTISANADDTYRLNRDNIETLTKKMTERFKNKECMIQPFMPAIVEEGEYSMFFFNNKFSHAILKKPKQADFRVQEEHGGQLKKITPEKSLLETAEFVLRALDYNLLYTRLDFVRNESEFSLMEAELIEPSLYFNLDAESPERFAKAIVDKMASDIIA